MVADTLWHSDGSLRRIPLRGSMLTGKLVTPEGGATAFASLVAFYALFLEETKTQVEHLQAEHSLARSREKIAPNLITDAFLRGTSPVLQPLVRRIPKRDNRPCWWVLTPPPTPWIVRDRRGSGRCLPTR